MCVGDQPMFGASSSQSNDSSIIGDPKDSANASGSASAETSFDCQGANATAVPRLSVVNPVPERPSFGYRPRLCSMSSDSDYSSSDSEDSATDDSGSEDNASHPHVPSNMPTGYRQGGASSATPTHGSTFANHGTTATSLSTVSSSSGKASSLTSALKSGGIRIPTSLMTIFNKEKEPATMVVPDNNPSDNNGDNSISNCRDDSNNTSNFVPGSNPPLMLQNDPRTANLKRLAYIHALRKLRERERRPFRHAVLLHLLLLQLRRGVSERHCEEIGKYYGNMTPAQLTQKLEFGNPSGLSPPHQYQQHQTYIPRLRMQGEFGHGPQYSYQRQPTDRYMGPFGQRVSIRSPPLQPIIIPSRTSSMPADENPSRGGSHGMSVGVSGGNMDPDMEMASSATTPVQSQLSSFRERPPLRTPSVSVPDYQMVRSAGAASLPSSHPIRPKSPLPPSFQSTAPAPHSRIPRISVSNQVYPPQSPTPAHANLGPPSYPVPPSHSFSTESPSIDHAHEPASSKINILPKRTTGRKGFLFQQQQQQQQQQTMLPTMGLGNEFASTNIALSSGTRPSFASTAVMTMLTDDGEMVTCPIICKEKKSKTPIQSENETHNQQAEDRSLMMNDYHGTAARYPGTSTHPLVSMPLTRPLSPPLVEGPSTTYHSQHVPPSPTISPYVPPPTFSSAMAPLTTSAPFNPPIYSSQSPSVGLEYQAVSSPAHVMVPLQRGPQINSSPVSSVQSSPYPPSMISLPQHLYPPLHERHPSTPDAHSPLHQYPQLSQRHPSTSDMVSPQISPFYPPPGAFTIAPFPQHQPPSFLPLPVRTTAEEQQLFSTQTLPMHLHSYQFPMPPPPPPPPQQQQQQQQQPSAISSGIVAPSLPLPLPALTLATSAPGIARLAPVPLPAIVTSSVPISPPILSRHALASIKSSPPTESTESSKSLTPPSSATSDATSISEESGGEDEEEERCLYTQRSTSPESSSKIVDHESQSKHDNQSLGVTMVKHSLMDDEEDYRFRSSVDIFGQEHDEFADTVSANSEIDPWSPMGMAASRALSMQSNLLLLPSMRASAMLPLPSPPLSPHPDAEFSPTLTTTTTITTSTSISTATAASVAENSEVCTPKAVSSQSPSTLKVPSEPTPRTRKQSNGAAPLSPRPSVPTVALARSDSGKKYASAPQAKLLFEPLSSAGHLTPIFTADAAEKEEGGRYKRMSNSALVEDLIRNLSTGSSGSSSSVTTTTATSATTATTGNSSKSNCFNGNGSGAASTKTTKTTTRGHTKRPSMNIPSIIISPSIRNNRSVEKRKDNTNLAAQRAVVSSMLPSPAPDSPLPGQENTNYEQRLRLLLDPLKSSVTAGSVPSPAPEDREEEDMPLAWVQMRLRN
ncbi:hypothetical protein BGW42_006585 [Actinomortierella wolfii]|nr:hypothetical protein BGW42_006585 [Actinomortierella wolfii]